MLSGRRILTANEDPFTPRLSRILCGIRMSLLYILLFVLSRSSSNFSGFPVAYQKIIYVAERNGEYASTLKLLLCVGNMQYASRYYVNAPCPPKNLKTSSHRSVSSLDARSSIARYRRYIITNKCRACTCSNPRTRDWGTSWNNRYGKQWHIDGTSEGYHSLSGMKKRGELLSTCAC